MEWKKHFDRAIDTDSIDDVKWVHDKAIERGNQYGISGVDMSLTLGVLKNVIPAIASTNAIIAAETVLETLKILTNFSKVLDNYFMYMGHQSLYASHDRYEKSSLCNVCNDPVKMYKKKETKLKEIIEELKEKNKLEDPSINYEANFVYAGGSLAKDYSDRLDMSIEKLIDNKILPKQKTSIICDVFDISLKETLYLRIILTE